MADWLSHLWYEGNLWLSMAGMTLLFSLRTEGQQHVPRSGPALLIANHQSYLDGVAVGVAARRHLRYLARQTLFRHRAFGWLLHSVGGVPIKQEGFAREGLKATLEQLQAGQAVLLFPEGERTADGHIRPLRPGMLLLIKRVDTPIVPVGIAGGYDAWPRWRPYPILAPLFVPAVRGTIAVSVGRPIDSRQLADQPRERVLANLLTELQKCKENAESLRRKA